VTPELYGLIESLHPRIRPRMRRLCADNNVRVEQRERFRELARSLAVDDDAGLTWEEAVTALGSWGARGLQWACEESTQPDAALRLRYRALAIHLATERPAPRPVDAVLAEAKAEGIPERIAQAKPCGGC
jgi:hypothetical protein